MPGLCQDTSFQPMSSPRMTIRWLGDRALCRTWQLRPKVTIKLDFYWWLEKLPKIPITCMLLKLFMISKTASLLLLAPAVSKRLKWMPTFTILSHLCESAFFNRLIHCIEYLCIYNLRTHTRCWLLHDATEILSRTKCFVNCDIIVSWELNPPVSQKDGTTRS